MKLQVPDRPTRLKLLGVIVLMLGLGTAAIIYHSAGNVPYGALGYEGGYPIMPEDSKQYLRSMELYGGTANVLADELRRWFVGWFQGKSLAGLIAAATLIISAGLFLAAKRWELGGRSEDHLNRGE